MRKVYSIAGYRWRSLPTRAQFRQCGIAIKPLQGLCFSAKT